MWSGMSYMVLCIILGMVPVYFGMLQWLDGMMTRLTTGSVRVRNKSDLVISWLAYKVDRVREGVSPN